MDHKIGKQLNVHLIKVAHLNYCRENSALRQYKCVHTRCCISLTDLKDQYKFSQTSGNLCHKATSVVP